MSRHSSLLFTTPKTPDFGAFDPSLGMAIIQTGVEAMMSESLDNGLLDSPECWPALPLEAWKDTYATLHMWTQIVGKVRLALTPLVNHWWNVPLYVNARGLTTSAIPWGKGVFKLQFDFLDHRLALETNDRLL